MVLAVVVETVTFIGMSEDSVWVNVKIIECWFSGYASLGMLER